MVYNKHVTTKQPQKEDYDMKKLMKYFDKIMDFYAGFYHCNYRV